MLQSTILTLAFGVLLALRFNALVLLPVTLLIMLLSVVGGLTSDNLLSDVLITGIFAAVKVQFGYVLGLVAFNLVRRAKSYAVPPGAQPDDFKRI
jgi:hypothetical protein